MGGKIRGMNKQITALALAAALFVAAPKVLATETVECKSQSYGGSTCGVSTSTVTTIDYEAGIGDMQISTVIMILGISAVAATALYKLTYRSYILG